MSIFLDADYLPIDIEGLDKCKINKKEFENGLKEGSYIAGISAALFNVGISEDNVTEILIEMIKSKVAIANGINQTQG